MLPAALLRNCSHAIAPALARIWRKSLSEGVIPPTCKSALIVPIHKGKSKAVAKNYRPVALTSQLSKVFEKVVRKYLARFMSEHLLFNENQHGFRAGRSCLSQLLSHFDTVTAHLEQGRGVDAWVQIVGSEVVTLTVREKFQTAFLRFASWQISKRGFKKLHREEWTKVSTGSLIDVSGILL